MQRQLVDRRRFLVMAGGALVSAAAASRLRLGGIARAQGLPSFQGASGKSMQGPVNLSAGMAVLRAQHNGTANFTVTIFLPAPGSTPQQSFDTVSYSDSSLVYDEIGNFKGGTVAMIGTPGAHYMGVNSSGAFQISVEQPNPATVTTVQQTTFSGKGKDVTPYFMLPDGITSLSVQSTSTSFRGWLYHLDSLGGAPVQGGINIYDGRFFDFTQPGNQTSYPVLLPDSGPYLLSTDNLKPTDTWTFTFQ